MPLYRDEAVVLRVHKLGEADRIVTLLTRRHGRVRAVGKGVRRTTSRFGARLEPGSHIDVQLYTRARRGPVRARRPARTGDGDPDRVARRVRRAAVPRDYARWTAASAICETAERLTERASRRCGCTCSSSGRCGRSPSASTTRAGARRVPDPGDGQRGLGAGADRVREVLGARAARGVQRRRGRRGVRGLPPDRVRAPAAGQRRS